MVLGMWRCTPVQAGDREGVVTQKKEIGVNLGRIIELGDQVDWWWSMCCDVLISYFCAFDTQNPVLEIFIIMEDGNEL